MNIGSLTTSVLQMPDTVSSALQGTAKQVTGYVQEAASLVDDVAAVGSALGTAAAGAQRLYSARAALGSLADGSATASIRWSDS